MTAARDLAARFDRLESERAALLDSLSAMDEPRLRRPPSTGGWSILQVVGHLRLVEAGSLSYIRKKMQDPAAIPAAGSRSFWRLALLAATLRSPLRLKAPERVAGPPAEVSLADARRDWDEVRQGWRDLIGGFPPERLGLAVFRHPLVGRLSLPHTLGFLREHFLHHRKQIDRLR